MPSFIVREYPKRERPANVVRDADPTPKLLPLLWEAFYRHPMPAVVVKAERAERHNVRGEARKLLNRRSLFQRHQVVNRVPPNLGDPLAIVAP
jgi:predicted component of type VI protein secretion system